MRSSVFAIALFCFILFPFNKLFPKTDSEADPSEVRSIDRIGNHDIEVTIPPVIFTFRDVEIKLRFKDPKHPKLVTGKNKIEFIINGKERELIFTGGVSRFFYRFNETNSLSIYTEDFNYTTKVNAIPLWAVLLPSLLFLWLIMRMTKKKRQKSTETNFD